MAADLTLLRRFLQAEGGLCVVSVARSDGGVSSSVVNAGVLAHPVTGEEVLGFVVRADAYKLRRARAGAVLTVTARHAWEWQSAEGAADAIGPLDRHPGAPDLDVPALLRTVFQAAGGSHDDWAEYDRVMAAEQRTAVFVRPSRVYGIARG